LGRWTPYRGLTRQDCCTGI